MRLSYLRLVLILSLLSAYFIAEHGFMLVRIPPGGQFGVPLAELTVLAFVLTFPWDVAKVGSFAQVAPITPLLIWWGFGFTKAAFGFYHHGIWAIRDASHLIDSLFIWIGFVVAATPGFLSAFSRWLRLICNIGVVYTLLYPLREQLASWAPKVPAPGGYAAPLLFSYTAGALMLLTGAVRLVLDGVRVLFLHPIVVPALLVAYALAVFQARTTYLQVLALIFLLACFRPRVALHTSMGLLAGIVVLFALFEAGLDINTRLGQKFTLEFIVNHFAAIWGGNSEGFVSGPASGTLQRLQWWSKIWSDVTSEPGNLLFGLGYGVPLTEFRYHNDTLVREPHNSTISIFARLGVLGLITFFWIHIVLARIFFRSLRRLSHIGDEIWRVNLLVMGAYILFVWMLTIGEDGLEKPFVAIPFYCFWGIILRVAYSLQVCANRETERGYALNAWQPLAARSGR